MKHAVITVSGLVQGVGFRYMVRGMARRFSLKGKVENMPDETVHITCEGQESDIESLVEAVRNAERPIEVDDVGVDYSEPTGEYANFRIVLGDILQEMVEGHATGAMYLHDIRGKQDQMLDKQDQTVAEIRSLSSDMHSMMESRFQRLEDEISKIKARLPE